jgi:glycosyltransferase involved in cell wall biosynthesis
MKVSVVIPVYNKAPYLKEALASVLTGVPFPLEVVLVDDASTDGSLQVLRSIGDERVRVEALPKNVGPAGAAQRAMDLARGEYIVRMDADDIALPGRIAAQVAYMDARPQVVASSGHVQLFGTADQLWRYPLTHEACRAQLLFGVPLCQGASILRTAPLRQHNVRYADGWPRVGEDRLYWLRVAEVGAMGNLDQPLIRYRRGAQNAAHGRDRYADTALVQQEVFRYFGIACTPEQVELHLIGLAIFKNAPTKAKLRALKDWFAYLARMNEERALFPQAEFQARLQELWSPLFFYLTRFSTGLALEHMRLSSSWTLQRLLYLAKYRAKAWLSEPVHA